MPGQGSPVPFDGTNFGTHMTGTSVGDKNEIGVAPKARFIACKFIDDLGRDNPESLLRCLQFFYAPHDLNGENPDFSRRPHIAYVPFCESCDNFVLRGPLEKVRDAVWTCSLILIFSNFLSFRSHRLASLSLVHLDLLLREPLSVGKSSYRHQTMTLYLPWAGSDWTKQLYHLPLLVLLLLILLYRAISSLMW